jgi:hypothetical protein
MDKWTDIIMWGLVLILVIMILPFVALASLWTYINYRRQGWASALRSSGGGGPT